MRQLLRLYWFCLINGILSQPKGYTKLNNTDCGAASCKTNGRIGHCGRGGNLKPCNFDYLASICDNMGGCNGFNSNGWVKDCLPPHCPGDLESTTACDLYVRDKGPSPPSPSPTPAPVLDQKDFFYPLGEEEQMRIADIPSVISISSDTCLLQDPKTKKQANISVGNCFGPWVVLSIWGVNEKIVSMERNFEEWGLIVYSGINGEVSHIRKSVGNIKNIHQETYNFSGADPLYFYKAANLANDFIGTRIVNESSYGEADFLKAMKFLAPSNDYTLIGRPEDSIKWIVCQNGKVKRSDAANFEPVELTSNTPSVTDNIVIFDPSKIITPFPSQFTDYKSGLVGGYLSVSNLGCFDRTTNMGFEMMAFAPNINSSHQVLIRVRTTLLPFDFKYYRASNNQPPSLMDYTLGAALFYSELLALYQRWDSFFKGGMQINFPWTERRQGDMARRALVAASTVFIGDHPNYGTGGHYWRSSPPAFSMLDTSGIPGSLPLTSLALDTALLQWGLFVPALSKIGFYFDTFIYPNGTIDMGHWKDIWPDAGSGRYNCSFPDALTDMGRMIDLFVMAVRFTRNFNWMEKHLPAVLRIGNYLLRARADAKVAHPPSDIRHGMIFGPAEHDTCTHPDYYFSNQAWSWRGLLELGRLLQDFPGHGENSSMVKDLLDEADSYKNDLDKAARESMVNKSGVPFFFPPIIGRDQIPFIRMTQNTLASYSNFRYYSEMLSATAFDSTFVTALMNFREGHGGTLSGMTRYTDHLDDMPAIGYARSALAHDRIDKFLLLLYGHAANYQSRGSFFSTEQMCLYGEGHFRGNDLGELQADFCVPSQMIIASMTALQFVSEERDKSVVWLARAAPRRWFGPAGGFSVNNGTTRFGFVNFSVAKRLANSTSSEVKVKADFTPPLMDMPIPSVMFRVRDIDGTQSMSSVTIIEGGDAVTANVISSQETVHLELKKNHFKLQCTMIVNFKKI